MSSAKAPLAQATPAVALPTPDVLQQALLRSERRFQILFEHTNDAVLVVDKENGRIVDVNDVACQMLGYARAELMGAAIADIHRDQQKDLEALAKQVFECGQSAGRLLCTTRGGETRVAQISAATLEDGDRTRLVAFLRDVSDRERLSQENGYLQAELDTERGFGAIVGRSAALKKVVEQVQSVAGTDASVLIFGESGTGKELVASEVHRRGRRSERPMVRVNCASIPVNLFESEFFGHVRGAFTGASDERIGRFQLADKGTLFLDEVGEIPLELQGKLLRVLQERQFERVGESRTRSVDVRVIAATNRDLGAEIRAGNFREDLYYRLSVFPIEVPPLRQRVEDIAPLAAHCLLQTCRRLKMRPPRLADEEFRALEAYAWPGNVRELQNAIERALILAQQGPLRFELGMGRGRSEPSARAAGEGMTLADLDRLERELIEGALRETGGRVYGEDGAAARLKLPPTTLASRIKRLGISRGRVAEAED
jgi:formate hydrogenlyase transcriptional activator